MNRDDIQEMMCVIDGKMKKIINIRHKICNYGVLLDRYADKTHKGALHISKLIFECDQEITKAKNEIKYIADQIRYGVDWL